MRIFFDVHGTLLSTSEREIRPGAAELLRDLSEAGHDVTLWSTAGAAYASAFARRYALQAFVCETISKRDMAAPPDICVDDSEVFLVGRVSNVLVSPYRGGEDREMERVRVALRDLLDE